MSCRCPRSSRTTGWWSATRRERTELLNRIVTNETRFFREPKQFDFLRQRVFPKWETAAAAGRRSRRIRVWSAACSTGEEPYSLAMTLLARFPPSSGWELAGHLSFSWARPRA